MRKIFITVLILALLLCGCSKANGGNTVTTASKNVENVFPDNIAEIESGMKIIFFNVGKGDAIAIRTANSTVLIDSGYSASGQGIADALKSSGVDKIDKMFITHFDKDHVGGAGLLVRYFEIGEIVYTSFTQDSEETKALRMAMSLKGLTGSVPEKDYSFELDGVTYYVYPPSPDGYSENEDNNSSIVIKAVYGSKSFLFTGDIDKERIDIMLESGMDLKCDFLKVPYHGNYYKGLDDFFDACGAKYAVITSSEAQPESSKTLKKLSKSGTVYYLTRNGTVVVTCDGSTVSVRQYQ